MDVHVLAQDVPQANSLDKIRCVVDTVAAGVSESTEMLERTELSIRHLNYYLAAAHSLGLLEKGPGWGRVTELGKRLIASATRSERESQIFREAVRRSSVVQAVYPGLLGAEEPSIGDVASRIEALTGLSTSTATRRAETLLTWRKRLVERQLSLFDLTPAPPLAF